MKQHSDIHRLFEYARQSGFAIGAFNVGNLETLKAVVQAAVAKDAPLIIEASGSEIAHWGIGQLRAVVDATIVETRLPILLNIDHAQKLDEIKQAIEVGFDLIHVDGSKLPLEENIALTKEVVELSHSNGAFCEAEMDHIEGSSDDHRPESGKELQADRFYTDPDKAQQFTEDVQADIFAAFFGNLHGVYAETPPLDFDRLEKIATQTSTFLSMHGGSGIPDDEVQRAIQVGGIIKINVNTDLRLAFRDSLRKSLQEMDSVKPYEFYAQAITDVQAVVEHKLDVFGATGQARKIQSLLQ